MIISKPMVAASSKPILLGIIGQGRSYGYQIIQKVRELSGGQLEWSDGMLYPVLHRMEKDGLILSEWVVNKNERPRKYYSITPQGRVALQEEKQLWKNVNNILDQLWGTDPAFAH